MLIALRAEDLYEILQEGTEKDIDKKLWDDVNKKWSTDKIKNTYKVGKIIGSGKLSLEMKLTSSSR